MDLDDFIHRYGEEAVRIVGGEVEFIGEGELGDVFDGADIAGGHACIVHLPAIGRYAVVDILNTLDEALRLQRRELIAGHGFVFFLPVHV